MAKEISDDEFFKKAQGAAKRRAQSLRGAEATPSIPIQEVISYLEAKRNETQDFYLKRIPEAGFTFGALEMRTELDAYNVIFNDLISYFRIMKLNKEKEMAGQ